MYVSRHRVNSRTPSNKLFAKQQKVKDFMRSVARFFQRSVDLSKTELLDVKPEFRENAASQSIRCERQRKTSNNQITVSIT